MHSHHAVIHLAQVAVPLPPYADRVVAALGNPRLVHHADRVWVSMIFSHDLLATVVEFLLIPLDGFKETL
jgi:hypothetical protein